MAIPRYDSPQVNATPIQAARVNPGMAVDPTGGVGQGLTQAAAGFSDIIKQADTLRAEESLNKLRASQQEYTGWVQGLKGRQVFDPKEFGGEANSSLRGSALGMFDAAADDAAKGLSPQALQMFKHGAARFRLEFDGHIQSHEAQQTNVVALDTGKGVQLVEDQNISQNAISPDGRIQTDTIQQSIQRKVFAANQLSDFLGEGPDMRKARELEARSGGHALVLDGLLKRNNAQAAQAYFDMNKKELDPHIASAMEGKIQQSILANDVQTLAQGLEGSGKDILAQLAEVDLVSKGRPELQKALSAEVEHRWQVRKAAQSVATQETEGKLWDMRFPTIPGSRAVSMPEIMRSNEWASLNGTQRNHLQAQWEAHAKRNENDPSIKVGQFATYMRILDDPKALMGMSDAQIASYTGTLGPEYSMKLMAMKREAAGNLEKLRANTLNDIPFKDIASEYGIKVKGSMSEDDHARLGLLRSKTLDAIRAEQDATGKPLGPERKEELLRRQLVEVSTKRKDDWFSHDRRLFEVGDFTELKATDDEKRMAVELLVRAEAPVNPSNVQTMIDAMRKPKQ